MSDVSDTEMKGHRYMVPIHKASLHYRRGRQANKQTSKELNESIIIREFYLDGSLAHRNSHIRESFAFELVFELRLEGFNSLSGEHLRDGIPVREQSL